MPVSINGKKISAVRPSTRSDFTAIVKHSAISGIIITVQLNESNISIKKNAFTSDRLSVNFINDAIIIATAIIREKTLPKHSDRISKKVF